MRNITGDSEIRVSKFRWETEVFRAVTNKITASNLRKLSNEGEALALTGRSGYSQKVFVVKRDDVKVDGKTLLKLIYRKECR